MQRRQRQETRDKLVSAAGGTGDRSDKVRTYNFPQDRVTDHRVNLTVPGVTRLLEGVDPLARVLSALTVRLCPCEVLLLFSYFRAGSTAHHLATFHIPTLPRLSSTPQSALHAASSLRL